MSDSLDEMTHACFIIQKHCSSDVMWSKNLEQKSWIAIPFTVTQTSQEHSRRIGNQSEWLAIQYSIQKVVRERYDQKKGVQNEESDRLIMIMTIVLAYLLLGNGTNTMHTLLFFEIRRFVLPNVRHQETPNLQRRVFDMTSVIEFTKDAWNVQRFVCVCVGGWPCAWVLIRIRFNQKPHCSK